MHLDAKYFGEGTVELQGSLPPSSGLSCISPRSPIHLSTQPCSLRLRFVLTYQHKEMLEYDPETLKVTRIHPFPYGEGWGLTTDGCDLIATTGSPYLYRLRRASDGEFKLVKKILVTNDGKSLRMLNEVEYVTPKLWVNEWITNRIWRVDPATGIAETYIDIGVLYRWRGGATPNGIAYSPSLGKGLLLVTGKNWPHMYSLRLTALDLCAGVQPLPSSHCAQAPPSACYEVGGLPKLAPAPPVEEPATVAQLQQPPATKQMTQPPTPAQPARSQPTSKVDLDQLKAVPVPSLPSGFSTALSLLGACMFVVAFASGLLLRYMRRRQRDTLHRRAESESDGG